MWSRNELSSLAEVSLYTELKHGQGKVCEIQFVILLLSLLLRKILSLSASAKPPTTHSLLLAISFNYSDNKISATL